MWQKRCFLILHGNVLTEARWNETFWYLKCALHYQLIWCKNYRKLLQKVYWHVFVDHSVDMTYFPKLFHSVINGSVENDWPVGVALIGWNETCVESWIINCAVFTKYSTYTIVTNSRLQLCLPDGLTKFTNTSTCLKLSEWVSVFVTDKLPSLTVYPHI